MSIANGEPIDLGPEAPKSDRQARKMQCLRMREVLTELHAISGSEAVSVEDRTAAAQQLARAMMLHFELITYALGIAGGTRKL